MVTPTLPCSALFLPGQVIPWHVGVKELSGIDITKLLFSLIIYVNKFSQCLNIQEENKKEVV